MEVGRNGDALLIPKFTFTNGWTVSIAVDSNRLGCDVMIWNGAGTMVAFPKEGSHFTDCELYAVSDDDLVLLLASVQKLSPSVSREQVGLLARALVKS